MSGVFCFPGAHGRSHNLFVKFAINTDTISESQKTDQTASYEPNNTECDPNVLLSSSVHRPEAGAEGSPTHCASTDKSISENIQLLEILEILDTRDIRSISHVINKFGSAFNFSVKNIIVQLVKVHKKIIINIKE